MVNRRSSHPTSLDQLLDWTSRRTPDRSTTRRRFRHLLDRCSIDHTKLNVIKVAGTNGKGTVCAMLESSLRAAGFRAGVFTSPHLERVTERIRIDGKEITYDRLEHELRELNPTLRAAADDLGPDFVPSFFEVILLAALRVFVEARIDWAIIEAGIGGENDATAELRAPASAVTTVGFDHESKLGHTLDEIAREKAGIASPNSTLVLGPALSESLVEVVRRTVCDHRIHVIQAKHSETANSDRPNFLADNAITVKRILESLDLPPSSITASSLPTSPQHAGRFELVADHPTWLLDSAHNHEAITALATEVSRRFADRPRVLIFGASRDKNYRRYLQELPRLARRIVLLDDFHNAVSVETLAEELEKNQQIETCAVSAEQLVDSMMTDHAHSDTLVIVTGSFFLVGRIRAELRRRNLVKD